VSPGGGPRQHSHSAGPGSPLIPEPATASPAPPARLSRNDAALAGDLGRRSRSPSNTLTALAGGWPRSACPCLALHGSGEPDSAASLDATGREMAGPPRRVPDVRPVLALHIKLRSRQDQRLPARMSHASSALLVPETTPPCESRRAEAARNLAVDVRSSWRAVLMCYLLMADATGAGAPSRRRPCRTRSAPAGRVSWPVRPRSTAAHQKCRIRL